MLVQNFNYISLIEKEILVIKKKLTERGDTLNRAIPLKVEEFFDFHHAGFKNKKKQNCAIPLVVENQSRNFIGYLKKKIAGVALNTAVMLKLYSSLDPGKQFVLKEEYSIQKIF